MHCLTLRILSAKTGSQNRCISKVPRESPAWGYPKVNGIFHEAKGEINVFSALGYHGEGLRHNGIDSIHMIVTKSSAFTSTHTLPNFNPHNKKAIIIKDKS